MTDIPAIERTTIPWADVLNTLFGAKSSKHQYDALVGDSDIGVLDLHPGQDDGNICCVLRHISMNNPTQTYTALSHVWGNASPLHSVTCNGHTSPVTSNLHSTTTPEHDWNSLG